MIVPTEQHFFGRSYVKILRQPLNLIVSKFVYNFNFNRKFDLSAELQFFS